MISEARVTTDRPTVHIRRLCKHVQLKVPAEFNDGRGFVEFAMGTCEMQVESQTLVLQVQADDAATLVTSLTIWEDLVYNLTHPVKIL